MKKGADTPVAPEEFRAALEALQVPSRFAVAVSGGPDSMALACLAAATRQPESEVFAFTVDHGLRPESAEEASATARWCEALGLSCQILRWQGVKPGSGLQDAARRARYRLLAEAASAEGAGAILTAHALNDQAETVFMRLARGSGPRGLSAMAVETLIAAGAGAPIRLLRPFLTMPRARLRATVTACGQEHIDDPSNEDPAFERVRVRALLAALAEQDLLNAVALARTAVAMRAAARRLAEAEDRAFVRAGGCFYRWGGASLEAARLDPSFAPVLSRLIHAVSGAEHPPGETEAEVALTQALDAGAATLAGALLKRRDGRLYVMREPAALLGRADLAPAEPSLLASSGRILWDGRFIIDGAKAGPDLAVAALGETGLAALGPRGGLLDAPREAALAAPAIWRGNVLLSAPELDFDPPGAPRTQALSLAEERYFRRILRFS